MPLDEAWRFVNIVRGLESLPPHDGVPVGFEQSVAALEDWTGNYDGTARSLLEQLVPSSFRSLHHLSAVRNWQLAFLVMTMEDAALGPVLH